MYTDEPSPAGRRLVGVEAAIVTDVDAVYADWGTPRQRAITRATPEDLASAGFAEGSMGPKVRAACEFVTQTGGFAAIGSIHDAGALLTGSAGTRVEPAATSGSTINRRRSADGR